MAVGVVREQVVKRFTRSSGWSKLRKKYLKKHPKCAACYRKATQVHHKKPFHLYPELELDENNLIGFCPDHHLLFGHLMWWKSYNPFVEDDAQLMKEKIEQRPEPGKEKKWLNL